MDNEELMSVTEFLRKLGLYPEGASRSAIKRALNPVRSCLGTRATKLMTEAGRSPAVRTFENGVTSKVYPRKILTRAWAELEK